MIINKINNIEGIIDKERHKDRPTNTYHGSLNKNDKILTKIKSEEITGQQSSCAL